MELTCNAQGGDDPDFQFLFQFDLLSKMPGHVAVQSPQTCGCCFRISAITLTEQCNHKLITAEPAAWSSLRKTDCFPLKWLRTSFPGWVSEKEVNWSTRELLVLCWKLQLHVSCSDSATVLQSHDGSTRRETDLRHFHQERWSAEFTAGGGGVIFFFFFFLTSVPDSGMKLLISTVCPGAGNEASLSFCMNG